MIAVDTNLLVYAHRAGLPQHHAARRAMEMAANGEAGWGITLGNVTEFWSVVTHSAAAGRPSTVKEAAAFLDSLRQAGAQLWSPTTGFAERLAGVARARNIHGPRIFDLQIALTAVEAGAQEIWTHDTDFATVPGLRVRDPLG